MDFNVSKSKVMHIGKTNPKKSYYMRGNILEEVDQENDLGIIISSDLKCSQQCLYASNEANKVLGVIRRTIINKERRIMMKGTRGHCLKLRKIRCTRDITRHFFLIGWSIDGTCWISGQSMHLA